MPHTVELQGYPTSPGLARGPLVSVDVAAKASRSAGSSDEESEALRAAINQAIADLAGLGKKVSVDSADIIAFQIAMLEDPELSHPAWQAIDAGKPADAAWMAALDTQITDYEGGDGDYFRARSADLRDLRDRVMMHLTGSSLGAIEAGAVLVGVDVTPTRFLETDWSHGGGILLTGGSASSHVAILARSRGVPMVIGLANGKISGHSEALVDGGTGLVVLSPDEAALAHFGVLRAEALKSARFEAGFAGQPAMTQDRKSIAILINIADPNELNAIDVDTCDGIGLVRTEFLFRDGAALPDEDTQYAAYCRLLKWAGGKPVTIRTLDAGGDKPIAGLTVDGETNTFLGVRGIRLSFVREEVFRKQLRALARAAVHGNLKIMWPMITDPSELDRCARLFNEELAALKAAGISCAKPQLGMMVEVPAPAIAPNLFEAAEFFSIGSNDLIQYIAAAARDNAALAPLADSVLPIIEQLVAELAAYGRASGIDVSICGDLASQPDRIAGLLRAGLRSLSVSPTAIGPVKAAIADIRLGD